EMAEGRDDIVHIAFGLDQAFAGVESFCASELVLALPNTFGNRQQEVTAFGGRLICPHTGFEGGACCSDGALGVLGGCLRDNTNFTAIGGTINSAGGLIR